MFLSEQTLTVSVSSCPLPDQPALVHHECPSALDLTECTRGSTVRQHLVRVIRQECSQLEDV